MVEKATSAVPISCITHHTHQHFSDLEQCPIRHDGAHAGVQAVDIMAWS